MKFTKMHGLGNDYVYVNGFVENLEGIDLPALAVKVSDRHFGIGSDGLILILPSDKADFRMRMFNADGSEGKTCGNGLRCVAKYVYDHGLTRKRRFSIETLGGIVEPEVHVENGKVKKVTIDMGEPSLARKSIPMAGENGEKPVIDQPLVVAGETYRITAVSMGNPHCVIFVDDADSADVARIGPKLEKHPLFPEGTNVEFIQVLNEQEMIFRVWERGSGITLACGTGACAAVVAAVLNGKTKRNVTVHLLGGDLQIEWKEGNNRVYMTGPAEEVFTGEYPLPPDIKVKGQPL
ncbi:diaminopimelate epimerase [Bacillaceae bacterium]